MIEQGDAKDWLPLVQALADGKMLEVQEPGHNGEWMKVSFIDPQHCRWWKYRILGGM